MLDRDMLFGPAVPGAMLHPDHYSRLAADPQAVARIAASVRAAMTLGRLSQFDPAAGAWTYDGATLSRDRAIVHCSGTSAGHPLYEAVSRLLD